jgi:uncharacterized membrane protein AbrB (regulator of aidB expression)
MVFAGAAVLLLIAAHLFVLGLATTHLKLPAAALGGPVLLAALQHFGLFAALTARLRRRARPGAE